MCTLDCHVICYHLVCQLPIVIYIPVTIWRQVSNQPINIQLGIKRSNSHNSTAAVRNKDKKKYGIISFSLKESVTSLPTLIMSAVCMFVVWLARKLHFHGFSSRQYSCMTVEINENVDKTPSSCPSVGRSFGWSVVVGWLVGPSEFPTKAGYTSKVLTEDLFLSFYNLSIHILLFV